jgi:hypothetical protein
LSSDDIPELFFKFWRIGPDIEISEAASNFRIQFAFDVRLTSSACLQCFRQSTKLAEPIFDAESITRDVVISTAVVAFRRPTGIFP